MFKTVSHRLGVVLPILTLCVLLVGAGCDATGENSGKSALTASESSVVAKTCTKTDAPVEVKKCEPGCTKPCCAKTDATAEVKKCTKTDATVEVKKCTKTDAPVEVKKCTKTDAPAVAKTCEPGCTKPCCAKTDASAQ